MCLAEPLTMRVLVLLLKAMVGRRAPRCLAQAQTMRFSALVTSRASAWASLMVRKVASVCCPGLSMDLMSWAMRSWSASGARTTMALEPASGAI